MIDGIGIMRKGVTLVRITLDISTLAGNMLVRPMLVRSVLVKPMQAEFLPALSIAVEGAPIDSPSFMHRAGHPCRANAAINAAARGAAAPSRGTGRHIRLSGPALPADCG